MLKLILLPLLIFIQSDSVFGAVAVKDYYKWNYINFSWPTTLDYEFNVKKQNYIPENNIPSKIRIYKDRLYVAFGRYYSGTPITLGYLYLNSKMENPLVLPYPNWKMNVQCDCSTLQNVNSFDIDKNGIMWILDGLRHNGITNCPAKLVVYNTVIDKSIYSYDFPNSQYQGTYLADIVQDNNYAYITDSNPMDPGIIVYSLKENTSWKMRDGSMFPDVKALKFSIDNQKYSYYHGVSAISLSPSSEKKNRFIYYSPLSSYHIYKLNVNVLRNKDSLKWNDWRQYVHLAGTKVDQSYDYGMNTNGDLYFCLVNRNSLAKWNIGSSFNNAKLLVKSSTLIWCSGFAFDAKDIYILTNNFGRYLIGNQLPQITKDYPFRILKVYYTKIKKS